MEKNIENYRRKLLTKTGAIAAVAGLAFSGCSTDKDSEWVFAISCPEEQEVRIGEVVTGHKTANINVSCGDDEGMNAPLSVELTDGEGVVVDEPVNEELQKVTVGYEYTANPMASQSPEIGSIKINHEGGFAQIALRDMYITEVSVSEK